MVEAVRKHLTSQRLTVFLHCHNTIRVFGAWSYKRTARGELSSRDDRFEDRNNDATNVVKILVGGGTAVRRSPIVVIGGECDGGQIDLIWLQPVPQRPSQATF